MPAVAIESDVLIVGAGPTGLLFANLLGSMGVIKVLVEKNKSTVLDPRAVSIDDESMRVLQAAGLSSAIGDITVKGYGSIYFEPSGKPFARVMPTVKEYGFDKRNAFEQSVFERVLRDTLARYDNVQSMFNTRMTDFEQSLDQVCASVIDFDGQGYRISSRYMVACDGGQSPVRRALGIKMEGSSFAEPWLIIDLKTTLNRGCQTEVFCDRTRPGITLPGPNGIHRYEFKLHPYEDFNEVIEEKFVRRLMASVGPDADQPLRRGRVFTFHARVAARWRQGRVFLTSDAAHFSPPFAGQGMNSGLRDAHNLAWKLDKALRGGSCEVCEALLESYQTERQPHAWALIQLAVRMERVMMPASRWQGIAIRSAFNLLELFPQAQDYIIQTQYKAKPRYQQEFLWHSAGIDQASLVGQMLPKPVVETVSHNHCLLDSVLPDQPVLLLLSRTFARDMPAQIQQQFEVIGVVIIGLNPEDINPVIMNFKVVRDQSLALALPPNKNYVKFALLIRRDRYIATLRPVTELIHLIEICKILLLGQNSSPKPRAASSDYRADHCTAVAKTA